MKESTKDVLKTAGTFVLIAAVCYAIGWYNPLLLASEPFLESIGRY